MLSPLLFNLYVNDLSRGITFSNVFQYADDTVLVTRHVAYSSAVSHLQEDALRIMNWFSSNLIKVNVQKTKLMCFRSPLKALSTNIPFFLHLSTCDPCRCYPIECVNSVKYLGIYFDSDLSFNTHLAYVAKRLRSVSCLLYNGKVFLPFSVRLLIANSLAYSVLRYGVTIFGNGTSGWHHKIDRILKAILKSVAYGREISEDDNVFNVLGCPTFSSLFKQTVVLKYYWNNLYMIPRTSDRSLRAAARFVTPRVFTNYGKSARYFYVPNVFNDLPDSAFGITTKQKLRTALKQFV